VLDDLRARDWTPRSVRAKARQLGAAVASLEHRLARAPEPSEIANALGIDLATYWRWQAAVDAGWWSHSTNRRRPTEPRKARCSATHSMIPTRRCPVRRWPGRADGGAPRRDQRAPDKARLVLAMYYFEELTLRQIAEVLHVTESRVSQIHTQSLRQLRTLLGQRGVAV